MKSSFRILALLLVITVLCLSLASCAGKFALTHKLLDWNNSLNKWLASFLLFLFIVIPVYGVCALIDWIILNVIEFYSGNNPVDPGTVLQGGEKEKKTSHTTIDGKQAWMTMYEGKGINVDLTTIEPDGTTKTLHVRTTDEGMRARLIEGDTQSVISAKMAEDGSIERCFDDGCEQIDADHAADTLAAYPALQAMAQTAD